jgi:hypothetical protein
MKLHKTGVTKAVNIYIYNIFKCIQENHVNEILKSYNQSVNRK